jgi:hypothetical protein
VRGGRPDTSSGIEEKEKKIKSKNSTLVAMSLVRQGKQRPTLFPIDSPGTISRFRSKRGHPQVPQPCFWPSLLPLMAAETWKEPRQTSPASEATPVLPILVPLPRV